MLYFESKRILTSYENKEGSVDSLIAKSQFQNKALLKALVSKILQYRNLIGKIIKRSKILDREQFLGDTLAQILVFDILFGTGVRGKFKSVAKRNNDSLQEAFNFFMEKYQCSQREELLKIYDQKTTIEKPKYIFMNTLRLSKKHIYKRFKEQNYVKIDGRATIDQNFKQEIEKLKENEYFKDDFIRHLLIFGRNSSMNIKNDLFIEGHLLQLDKSSCMAPFALNPPENSYIIDACAAPGNKTILLANIIKNTGLIYAFDLSAERVNVMKTNLKSHHVNCVRLKNYDFLATDPQEYERVEYILLDPSCSGSGINKRFISGDTKNELIKDESRIWNLEALQRKMLLHAMSFKNVKRIVYSTCSIHEEENEHVVLHALKTRDNEFRLENIFPEWPRRGRPIEEGFHLEYTIRTDMHEDLTNGFFVACFVRSGSNKRKLEDD